MCKIWAYRAVALATVFSAIIGIALPVSAGDEVPFKGRAAAVITGAELVGTDLHLTVSATGVATHLGRFTRTENVVLHADGTFDGTLVFTAANGDQLRADVAAGFTGATTIAGTYTFTGGTGRFTDASGEADFVGVASGPGQFAIEFDGTVSF